MGPPPCCGSCVRVGNPVSLELVWVVEMAGKLSWLVGVDDDALVVCLVCLSVFDVVLV